MTRYRAMAEALPQACTLFWLPGRGLKISALQVTSASGGPPGRTRKYDTGRNV
jgi:hypothetical protein